MKQQLINAYLDYFNNYVTIAKYAEYNNISLVDATRIIRMGRKYNEELSKLKS